MCLFIYLSIYRYIYIYTRKRKMETCGAAKSDDALRENGHRAPHRDQAELLLLHLQNLGWRDESSGLCKVVDPCKVVGRCTVVDPCLTVV